MRCFTLIRFYYIYCFDYICSFLKSSVFYPQSMSWFGLTTYLGLSGHVCLVASIVDTDGLICPYCCFWRTWGLK